MRSRTIAVLERFSARSESTHAATRGASYVANDARGEEGRGAKEGRRRLCDESHETVEDDADRARAGARVHFDCWCGDLHGVSSAPRSVRPLRRLLAVLRLCVCTCRHLAVLTASLRARAKALSLSCSLALCSSRPRSRLLYFLACSLSRALSCSLRAPGWSRQSASERSRA